MAIVCTAQDLVLNERSRLRASGLEFGVWLFEAVGIEYFSYAPKKTS